MLRDRYAYLSTRENNDVYSKQLCKDEIQPELFEDSDDPIALFTDRLCDKANRTVPKSSAKPKQRNKPWFNEEC